MKNVIFIFTSKTFKCIYWSKVLINYYRDTNDTFCNENNMVAIILRCIDKMDYTHMREVCLYNYNYVPCTQTWWRFMSVTVTYIIVHFIVQNLSFLFLQWNLATRQDLVTEKERRRFGETPDDHRHRCRGLFKRTLCRSGVPVYWQMSEQPDS